MRLEVTPDMFAGNFICELPSKKVVTKTRPNGTTTRFVLLRCLHCNSEFEKPLHIAKRIKQKCCSHACYKKLVEVFDGGNEKHPLYTRWLAMKQRVNNPASNNYANYGNRGIQIKDGLDDFVTYANYVTSLDGYNESKLSISLQLDRIDNEGHYEKGNLRWTDRSTQIANQRSNSRGNNKYTGVVWSKIHNRWIARVNFKGKIYCSSVHLTQEEALNARNLCIKEHNLPHPIQEYTV